MTEATVLSTAIIKFEFENFIDDKTKAETDQENYIRTGFDIAGDVLFKKEDGRELLIGRLETGVISEKLKATGVVMGIFSVPESISTELLSKSEFEEMSEEGKKIGSSMSNALVNKFVSYVGLITGDSFQNSLILSTNDSLDQDE